MQYSPVGQGERGRVVECGNLRLTESRHPSDGRLDWHAHRERCMTLLLRGGMRESFPSDEVDGRRGSLIVKPAEARHRTRFGPAGAHCLIVELVGPARSTPQSPQSLSSPFARVSHRPVDGGFARRIVTELAVADTASDVLLEGIALQLLGLVMRATPTRARGRRPAAWLSEVHDRIQSDFLSPLSIADLAAAVGVHPDHLGRSFRLRYGRPIGELIRDLRLSWAAEQVTRTDRDLSVIALEAGFCDQSHFTGAFRRRFGVTPGKLRRAR